jgi:hypothetical protein
MAGYSGTPLVRKLGLKPGQRAVFLHAPADYQRTLGELPDGVQCSNRCSGVADFIQLFAGDRATLQEEFEKARGHLAPDGALWISWPKRASGIRTDLNGDTVRAAGLKLGLVDVKVCAVDETWSGLKFVFRLKDRPGQAPGGSAAVRRGTAKRTG